MTPTPEPNSARLVEMARRIEARQRFLLLTHVNPDGDALGSMLALGLALETLGKHVTMFSDGLIPSAYAFLPGLDRLAAHPGEPEDHDVVILLDHHELARAGKQVAAMSRVPETMVVDHHLSDGPLPAIGVIDTSASAAGEIVHELIRLLGLSVTRDMAVNLFVAINTDTGSFSYENTSARCLRIAAELIESGARPWDIFRHLQMNRPPNRMALLAQVLASLEYHHQGRMGMMTVTLAMLAETGSTIADTDGFVEYPRLVRDVELAVLLREDGPTSCKVSLRSRGRANAAAMAQKFGGGGHYQAAGFNIDAPLAQAKSMVVSAAALALPPA